MKRFARLFALTAIVTAAGFACDSRKDEPKLGGTNTGEMTNELPDNNEGSATGPYASDDLEPVSGSAPLSSQVFVIAPGGARLALTDSSTIHEIEIKLSDAGLSPGAADGKADAELSGAISQFQAKKGLPMTGAIDQETANALGLSYTRLTAGAAASSAASGLERGADKAQSGMKEGWHDVKGGLREGADDFEDVRKDVSGNARELGSDVKEGASEFGRDVRDGSRQVGSDLKEGTRELRHDVGEGADKAEDRAQDEYERLRK